MRSQNTNTRRGFKKNTKRIASAIDGRIQRASHSAIERLEERKLLSAYIVDTTAYLGTSGKTSLEDAIQSAITANDTAAVITFNPAFISPNSTIQLNASDTDPAATAFGYGPTAFYVAGASGNAVNITVDGSAAPGLTIDGGGAGGVRLFAVETGSTLNLVNLTLKDGDAVGGAGGSASEPGGGGGGGAGLGGGVFVKGGTFTAQGCTFSNNIALGGSAAGPSGTSLLTGSGGGGMGTGSDGKVPSNNAEAGAGGGARGGFGGSSSGTRGGGTGGFGGGGGGGAPTYGVGGSGGTGGGGGGGAGFGNQGGPGGFGGGGGGGAGGNGSVLASHNGGEPGAGGFGAGKGAGGVAGFSNSSSPISGQGGQGGGGAGLGGGIFGFGGTITLTDDTFNGNSATGGTGANNGKGLGGAIFDVNGDLTVQDSTISGNTAPDGGRGIYLLGQAFPAPAIVHGALKPAASVVNASLEIDNTIVGQSDTSNTDVVAATSGIGTYRTDGTGDLIRTQSGLTVGVTIVSVADPNLAALANNGGPTQTMALNPGSPAINAGVNAVPPGLTTDQRGDTRIVGGTVDIGAFEVQPATADIFVTDSAPTSVTEGELVYYTVDITNNGPGNATNVVVQDQLDPNTDFEYEYQNFGPAFTATDPAVGSGGTTVTYNIPTLASGTTAEFIIETFAPDEGSVTNHVTASNSTPDPNTSNNSASATTTIADAALLGQTGTLPVFVEGQPNSSLPVASFYDTYGGDIFSITGDPEGAADFTATITWGDGTTTPGTITQYPGFPNYYTITAPHTFAEEGTNLAVKIHIADDGGQTADVTDVVQVVDAPIFGAPNNLVSTEGISQTGSAQTLTENKATGGTFKLSFNGATTGPLAYNASAVQVQNALNGLITVIAQGGVTVSQNTVGTSTVDEVVFTGKPAGTAEPQIIPITTALTGTGHSIQDATYFGVIASFTDADPAGMVGDYVANINWGDGSSGTVGVIVANSTGGFDVLAKHSFGEEGSYQTVVSIQDAGTGTSATSTIDVADPAVVAAAATPSAFSSVEGASTGSLVLATFTDPGGAEPNKYDPDPNLYDHYTATINWGDGSTPDLIDGTDPNGTITFNAATKTFTVHGTHSYLEESAAEHPGSTPYIVSVVIHHEEAPDSNIVTDTVTVSDPAVIGNAGTTFTGVEGQSTGPIKVAVFSDPGIPVGGTPEPVGDYSATVNWGDGSAPDNSATISYLSGNFFSVTDSHTWAEESPAGKPLFVKVTVHHEAAPDAVVTTDLATVTDPSVVAAAVPQISGTEGAPTGVIALATFSDPGTPAGEPLADYSATINWGDGTAPSVGSISGSGGAFTVSGSHTYKEESGPDEPNSQPYQVTVTINHDTAAPTIVSDTAVMADPAVVAVGVPAISAKPGVSTGTIALATFSDPGGNEPSDDYSATINWGDGSSQVAGTVTLSNGVLTVTGSHVFDVPGTFHPTIVVHHESAPDSNVVTDTVNVVAPKPTLTASATSNNGQEGRSSTITVANFVSTISNAATSNFTASIAWGDGATTTGVIVKDSSGHFHVTGSHAYAEEQSTAFTVKVTIKDNAGNTAVANSSYKIVDSPLDSGAGVSISEKHGVAFSKVTLGTFRDQDALNTNAGDYKGTINWGDGTSTSAASFVFTSATSNVGSYWKVLGGHTYSTSGKTYTVKITIQDTGGSSPITITSTIKTT